MATFTYDAVDPSGRMVKSTVWQVPTFAKTIRRPSGDHDGEPSIGPEHLSEW